MRLVFCGTPPFAVPTLKFLAANSKVEIAGVISQPDRPRGRGQALSLPAVKEAALELKLPTHQPEKIRSVEAQNLLEGLKPDCIVIIAYGQIIPERLLRIPPLGWINLHASLLPKYRGAAPINWAIANGETKTGLTTMRIDAGMDTGDILLRWETAIGERETAPELAERMAQAGAPLMAETLHGLKNRSIAPRGQNHSEATHAPILKKEDGQIDWDLPAATIFNRMRGFAPWPGAYTTFRGQTCHVWGEPDASTEDSKVESAAPGTLFKRHREWYVSCGRTTVLRLSYVKVEGRKQVTAGDFANGAHIAPGERLGASRIARG